MAAFRTCRRQCLVVLAITGLASLCLAAPAAAQSVTTDKANFRPGETVTIIGEGWQPGETVQLVIRDDTGVHPDEMLESLADGVGGFTNTGFGMDWTDIGLTWTLTALGLSSGATAHTGFACDQTKGNGSLCGGSSPAGCDGATTLTPLSATRWEVPGGSAIIGAISGATDASAASVAGTGGGAATSQCCIAAAALTASGSISPMQLLGTVILQADGTWLILHEEENTFEGTLSGMALVSLAIVVDPFTGDGTVTGDFAFAGLIGSTRSGTATLQLTGTVTAFTPSGSWDITGASGDLAGTTGSGTWTMGFGAFGFYEGSVTLPAVCTRDRVDVQIRSSVSGNTVICGGLSAGTISFPWTAPSADGGPACETATVAYRNCVTDSSGVTTCGFLDTNNTLLPGGDGQAAAGYAVSQGPPFADPGGPYTCLPGQSIQLDGSGSHGTSPTEPVTYAWDLDNNGLFADSVSARPNFTCGNVSGTVYSVCLRVTSTCGSEDTGCTTVSVVVPACTASDQCHLAGTFDPVTGTCSNPARPDGTSCSDGNACTQTDTCQAGVCRSLNYAWTGALQPINDDGSSVFKLGSTVPVKFKLTSPCAPNGTLTARIFLAKVTDSILGTEVEASSTSAADTGNAFRYDASGDQYIYNLTTRALSAGTWQIRIAQYLGDVELVTIGTVNISLRK